MSKTERPLCLSFLFRAAIWSVFLRTVVIAQAPPPAPAATGPGGKPSAPELRATPPTVAEPTEPSLPELPKPPEPPNVPLPEQLYIPNLGTLPGLIMPTPPPGSVSQIPPLQRIHRVGK